MSRDDPPLPAELSAPDVAAQLAALRSARGTPRERRALGLVAEQRAGAAPSVLILAAEIAAERGERELALGLLSDAATPAALLFAADLEAEAGRVARALSLVERVLARDVDLAGAEDRRQRWAAALGHAPRTPQLAADVTLLAAAPRSTLRVVGEAGRGGAGVVYEAVDDVLDRSVALKAYHRPLEDRGKLLREARVAVRLRGPGIIRIYDVDLDQGTLTMEWQGGGSLSRALERRDARLLGPCERWFVGLTAAVARVHRRGLVHADLKPSNVLLDRAGAPVLSDFGLARETGELVEGGSRGYLSPERLAGDPVTPAADVYALGRILEDALASPELAAARAAAWRQIAAIAVGDVARRPPDAGALSGLISSLIA